MPQGKVLVVDDEPDVRVVCQRGLSQLGYEVIEANSGSEAVVIARNTRFDLLLLDFRMPGMDGLETFRAIKTLQPDVLGVMMTAFAAVDNAVQAVNLGLSGFVLKPFQLQQLQHAVQEALNKREREREKTRAIVLRSLARVSTALTGTDLDAVLENVMQVAMEETRSETASLLLFANKKGGSQQHISRGRSIDLYPDLVEIVADAQIVVLRSQDAEAHPALFAALRAANLGHLVVMRLELPTQSLGLLCVGRDAANVPYSNSDLEALKVLASQTAVVVSNARLFGQVVEGERLNQALRSYLSPRTVRAVLEGETSPGAVHEPEMMTVLLADVVDFSTLVERAELERIIEIMHEYFSASVEIISAEQGIVDELSGDEILASFDHSGGRTDDALRAVRAGLQMHERLDTLRSEWAERGLPFFDIGIGISSGAVAVGSIGTGERRALVTAGRILNLAARSQALTRQTGLHMIITQGTFEQVRDQIRYRELGAVRLKGIAEPVGLYGVYGLK